MDEKRAEMMGKTPIGHLIWKMSVPSIIGVVSYNLYIIVDTIYISRGIGAYTAGGLAKTLPLFIISSCLGRHSCP